jgi:hypothetical protein
MFDRELLNRIVGYTSRSNDPLLSSTVRLENRLFTLLVILQAIVGAIESLQRFYDDANIAALLAAADAESPLEESGIVKKRSIIKYLAMIVSFRTWLTTPISAQVTETPRQLLSRQPENVQRAPVNP